jgi:subtilase family serine protease
MKFRSSFWIIASILFAMVASAAERQVLNGHVPEAIARLHLQPLGRLPATNRLRLAISLPLRNRDALTNLLQRLYDPASPDYHHYLTPEQFTARFGPTAQDYEVVTRFAKAGGLEVVGTHSSRILLDVEGKVSDVEKAFHVTLHTYQHPTEHRQFYAPDVEPSVDPSLPIVDINGLSDYALLRPMFHKKPAGTQTSPASGSAPGGYYMGSDFRNAYAPGVSLNGAGQMVGLFEADSYYASDITAYEKLAGLPNVPLINVPIGGGGGTPGSEDGEVSLDIEMAIAMAPGLSAVVVFEGPNNNTSDFIDILDSMASSNQIKQFSSSWGYTGTPDPNTSFDTEFQKMALQGQSFFQAAGDGDAYVGTIQVPADSPYVTSVGGTSLTMSGSGVAYSSETVWNSNYDPPAWGGNGNSGYWGSGGGVSTVYSIPSWQEGVSMAANDGSTTMRNIPDVALTAEDIFVVADDGEDCAMGGTSCAAPLWAGFTALVNQQAAINGQTNVGFLNPQLYTIGTSPPLSTYPFHDIVTGSNTWSNSPYLYYAVPGYDLCTGWGTPNGSNLINALLATPPTIYNNQPQSQSASVGNTVNFAVVVLGTLPFSYQWFWNDSAHPLHDGGNISGSLTSTLTISNVQATNAGSYYVLISNPAASVTSGSAELTVYVTAPSTTITFDDLSTPTVSGEFHTGSIPSGYDGLNWSNFYVVNGVLATNTGYHAGVVSPSNVVYNGAGTAAYIYNNSPFDFISAYLTGAWNDNLLVQVLGYAGSSLIYSNIYILSAINPTLINFNYLGVNEVYFASFGGTAHTNYTTSPSYQFAMDNMTVTTNLAVETSPQVIVQPTNQTGIPGATATFTVSAAGTTPLSYQWQKNGNRLADGGNILGSTTRNLTVSNISAADVGTYSVIVSNPYGSMISTGAVLSVYVAGPTFQITSDDISTPTVSGEFHTGSIPPGYDALNWSNYYVVNGVLATNTGYHAGVVSPSNVVYNGDGNAAYIYNNATFNFISAYLTAAWNDNLQVEVLGYLGTETAPAYSNTYTLSATAPTLINFNYLGLSEVYFVSSGGTLHTGYNGSGTEFAMDNMTVSTNVLVSVLPTVQTSAKTGNKILFSWDATVGQTYQVQYKTNLTQTAWNNLDGPITATISTIYVQDSITNSQRFYRIVLMP